MKDEIRLDEKYLNKTVDRQIKLIKKAISLLKKGGILIYSTCSILKEENEMALEKILSDDIILEDINLDIESKYNKALTILPDKYYEGFFVAKIKKY